MYPKQALVLVNCGDCDGNDVVRRASTTPPLNPKQLNNPEICGFRDFCKR